MIQTVTPTTTRIAYDILDDLKVDVEVLSNPYNFTLDELFQVAARINPKRSFLFVSKILGKHLAIDPKVCLLTGHLLAMRYMEVVHGYTDTRIQTVAKSIQTRKNISSILSSFEENRISLPESVTCIGFAETATALGHTLFSSFTGGAKYIHTTRERIEDMTSVMSFEEEHSHATSHRVYALNPSFFDDTNEILLVDDEITTGKTAINMIRILKVTYPQKKKFTVISILDWRTLEHRERYRQLEEELDIIIRTVSLIEGIVHVTGQPKLLEEKLACARTYNQHISSLSLRDMLHEEMYVYKQSISEGGMRSSAPYLKATGRFGIGDQEEALYQKKYKEIGEYLRSLRKGKHTLVIGTGEFMYIPMRIASYMGDGTIYQSTTRSPIYQTQNLSYPIQQKFIFDSVENVGLTNFLYNIQEKQYDEIFLFVERLTACDTAESLLRELQQAHIPFVQIVTMA